LVSASVIITTEKGTTTEAGLIGSDGIVCIPLLLDALESNSRVMMQIPQGVVSIQDRHGLAQTACGRYTNVRELMRRSME